MRANFTAENHFSGKGIASAFREYAESFVDRLKPLDRTPAEEIAWALLQQCFRNALSTLAFEMAHALYLAHAISTSNLWELFAA